MDAQICQQCKEATNTTDHRIVRDSCGHYKCRSCLVQEIDGCRTCSASAGGEALPCGDTKQKQKQVISVAELQAELLTGKRPAVEEPSIHRNKKKREASVMPKNIVVELDESGAWYNCTVCEKRSRARSHIAYHAYCDGQIKPHTCTICQKGFATRSHYEYHVRVHEGHRPFICDACGLAFYQKSKLKRHVLKHTGEKRFPCAECGAAFNNAASLRKHGLIHSGVKPHRCGTCHRQFRDSSNLRKHESKHQNVKHTCGECGKQYGVKWSLMLHAKSHREARPYCCPQCPQAFYSKKDMRRHAAVHSDYKPYRCILCGTRFRRKDNLDRHLRNTHPGVDASKSFEIIDDLTQENHASPPPTDRKMEYDSSVFKTHSSELEVPCDITKERVESSQNLEASNASTGSRAGERANDFTEQNILEANNRRQTVIFGPMKPNNTDDGQQLIAQVTRSPQPASALEDVDKYKHFKKKITNMEIYRNILVPKYTQENEIFTEKVTEKPMPEYIHKKVNYELKNELKKRGEQMYCSQVPPITIDKIDRIVRESSYYPRRDDDYRHPPEKIELYKKILMPDYKDSASTSNVECLDVEAHRGEVNGEPPRNTSEKCADGSNGSAVQPSPDMHWRRRMALNTNR